MNEDQTQAIAAKYEQIYRRNDLDEAEVGRAIPIPAFSAEQLMDLCKHALNHFRTQGPLLELGPGIFVVGDLHGNIRDLVRILYQAPPPENRILFLGDYVDRGEYSVEVITLLLSLSVKYPDHVFLIRGNHEFAQVNSAYGFYRQIIAEYQSVDLWEAFQAVFSWLPLAAVIGRKFLCIHGGLSPHFSKLSEISSIVRPINDCSNPIIKDMMWSDPSPLIDDFSMNPRGHGVYFGTNMTKKFLEQNKLAKLIRAHQCIDAGVELFADGRGMTVFSSSNYCNLTKNLCGLLNIKSDCELSAFNLRYLAALKKSDAKFASKNVRLNASISLRSVAIFLPVTNPMERARNQKVSKRIEKSMSKEQFFSYGSSATVNFADEIPKFIGE